MLGTIYRQHTEHAAALKQKQGHFHLRIHSMIVLISLIEKKKKELLTASDQFTRLVLDGLNSEYSSN